jgi:acyl carrier protein
MVVSHARANAVNLSQCIDEIVLMGFCTSICVISNALYLRGLMPNTKITVMEDLCADVTPESHIAACTVLRNCQIEVNVPTFAELDTRIIEITRPSDEEIEKIVFDMLNHPDYNFRDDKHIDKNSKFKEDCNFDSLDEVQFIMEIEEKFGISIPNEEATEVKSVGDVIKLISSKKN